MKINVSNLFLRSLLGLSVAFSLSACNDNNSSTTSDDGASCESNPSECLESDNDDTWDIEQWKITIPDSKNDYYSSGGTTAAELEPEHCQSSKELLNEDTVIHAQNGASIKYFEKITDGQNERLHFRADLGYGTTTENSNYIRSELRELYNTQTLNSCSTSTQDSSWKLAGTGGNEYKSHTLTANVKIEQYPSIKGQDPKVIVGQIHGWEIKQALIKLQWDGPTQPVRAIINKDFAEDNESCNNCSFSVELGTYAANTEWQYRIQMTDQYLYINTNDGNKFYEHKLSWGENYLDKDGKTIYLTNDWTKPSVAFYFKAGIYPQITPNSNNAGEIFDVSFSKILIDHQ